MDHTAEKILEKEESAATRENTVYDLILQRIRLRARRRIAWLRRIWMEAAGEQTTDNSDYHSAVDGYLNNTDNLADEMNWYEEDEEVQQWNAELAETEQAIEADRESQMARLSRTFGLTPGEKDILQACLALNLDPNIGRVYAYLQDHNGRGYVTAQLVARLFGHGLFLPLPPSSPLITWSLITETEMGRGEPARLDCDPFIRNWLLGITDLDESLTGIARIQDWHKPLDNWPVNETLAFITRMMKGDPRQQIRILVIGGKGSGRSSFSAAVCRKLGLVLLSIPADRIAESNWPHTYMRAQRQAYLDHCALLWQGDAVFERAWPVSIPSLQLQFVAAEPDQALKQEEGVTDYRVELPAISAEESLRLWRQLVPAAGHWPEEEFMQLISRRKISIGQIASAAKKQVTTLAEAAECTRASSVQQLGKLAQQMNSSFSWNDLVIPDWLKLNLTDFAFEATERHQLWNDPEVNRQFPQGRGLVALFSGSPGTGKTMAAQVIANSIQLELFRIDLSAIVSKYVGETSKNIERILSRAQTMDLVLLFDEADALFGKRTEIKDAHDRFANTDTNYLLQAIEQYPGIAILATNRKANIDGGFLRRLRYVLEFPKPEAPQRLQLWRNMMRAMAGSESADALEKDLGQLAGMLEITGAQIKLSILSALFMAKREGTKICLSHLLCGLERELMKEGRGLGQAGEAMKGKMKTKM